MTGTGRQYSDCADNPVLINRYHPRIIPVLAPILIASTAPVSGSTGVMLRPLLKSDWAASPKVQKLSKYIFRNK